MITPRQKYNNAVISARQRGIDWQFTFESWMEWWGADFALRGNRATDLCMARTGDTGAYHPNNVRKATNSENVTEMRVRVKGSGRKTGEFKHSAETLEKMSVAHKGRQSWNKGLSGTGRCQAWNKGLTKQQQLAYSASKGE